MQVGFSNIASVTGFGVNSGICCDSCMIVFISCTDPVSDEVEGSGTAVEPSYVVEAPSSGNEGSSEGGQQHQSDQVRGSLAYSQPLAITGPAGGGNSAGGAAAAAVASTEGGGGPSSGTEIAVPSR